MKTKPIFPIFKERAKPSFKGFYIKVKKPSQQGLKISKERHSPYLTKILEEFK